MYEQLTQRNLPKDYLDQTVSVTSFNSTSISNNTSIDSKCSPIASVCLQSPDILQSKSTPDSKNRYRDSNNSSKTSSWNTSRTAKSYSGTIR